MRFPRVRVPRFPLPSLEWLGALGGRTMLLYVGYTAVLFLVFLLVTFPHEQLVRRALSSVNRGPVDVDFKTLTFAWLHGYELSGMRVASASVDDQPPYLECSHVWVRPSLNALVRGNPYDLLVSAELYGGAAQGEVRMTNGTVAGNFQWRDLSLNRYRTLTALFDEGELAGRLSGQFSFEARTPNVNTGQGSGEVRLDAASLTAAKISGFTVPDLRLRRTSLTFSVRSGHLDIQQLEAVGDVNVKGSGQIVLREPLQNSVLNLRATITTSLETPDAIKGAVALIPRPRGAKPDAPITITGTLAQPRFR